jgi:sulfur carrier protein ThiS
MTTDIARSSQDRAQVHGIGTFDIEFVETGDDTLKIAPDSLRNRDSTFIVEVNDHRVHRWDGHERLDSTCLYPGDRIEIVSKEGETTYPVQEYELERALSCERIRPLPEKFEYAYIENQTTLDKVRVQPDFTFGVEIDPDGSGTDDTMGYSVHKQNIGTIPVNNQWHYIRKYDEQVEGMEPPVWVIVMTDNVHWKYADAGGSLNWTDDPTGAPGSDSYEIDDSTGDLLLRPDDSEPTNDIYMVFKPGCSGSDLKIVDVSAGYHNTIYVNGQVAVPDTYEYSQHNDDRTEPPVELSAPAVNCPTDP